MQRGWDAYTHAMRWYLSGAIQHTREYRSGCLSVDGLRAGTRLEGLHTKMARNKNKKGSLAKDIISPEGLPEDYLVVGSAIWWEANSDKSKKYGRKKFQGKEVLTPKEAEIFLEISGNWLACFMRGEKDFPALPYSWDGSNVATVKFAREDLVKYRKILQGRKFYTKARPQRK